MTRAFLGAGLACVGLAAVVWTVLDLALFRDRVREHLEQRAYRVAAEIEKRGMEVPVASSMSWRELETDPWVREAHVMDWSRNVLANFSRGEESRLAFHAHTTSVGFFGTTVRLPIAGRGEDLGWICVASDPSLFWTRFREHLAVLAVLLGTTVLVSFELARRLYRHFSDQILDLAHAANAISAHRDYSIRAMRRSEDEVGLLVDTFNHMITNVELREQRLQAEIERADEARIAKAQFLATMSHEIRTPINGILGMTELLLETKMNAEQHDFAKTVHRSAVHLLSVINDILDFSKGEAGRYEFETIPFSLSQLVDECLDTVAIAACEKGIELCSQVEKSVPSHLRGDPARLRQVLLNLLSNALKFTDHGDVILRVACENEGNGSQLRFEVQDSGIGIPKDRQDRLFQCFSQVDASNNRRHGGTGLGLAISKQIVEGMGGSMFVETQEGVGSTFGFRLQLPKEGALPEEKQLPTGLRILIADPSPATREGLAIPLAEGNRLEFASNGEDARKLLVDAREQGEAFDLLLLDYRLDDEFRLLDVEEGFEFPPVPLVLLVPVHQLASASPPPWPGPTVLLARPVKREEFLWCIEELLRSNSKPIGKKAGEPPASKGEEPSLVGFRVLVAEDHPVNQKITTRFLERLGVHWQLAENGEEAVRLARHNPFDLILMDVQMPVMDGLEATLAIRQFEALRAEHVPIVAMTAAVLEEDRRLCREAGFDDYLPKPMKLEDLKSRLLKWAERKASEAVQV